VKDVYIGASANDVVDDLIVYVDPAAFFADRNDIPTFGASNFLPSSGQVDLHLVIHNPDDATPAFVPDAAYLD
jgi:hypothetical protein